METPKAEATLLDVAEQMQGLGTQEVANVLLQLTVHTTQQIMQIAQKALSPKAFRKLSAAVNKARGAN